MGRKPGTWITKKGYSVLNAHRQSVIKRVVGGEPLTSVAASYNTAATNLHRWLKAETSVFQTKVPCILVECQNTFSFKPGKRACCRKHIKRYNARGGPGEFLPCSLPECDALVLVPTRNSGKLWWCDKNHERRRHSDIHYQRVANGFYERLLTQTSRCVGKGLDGNRCKEHCCIDEHHVVFDNKGSDKSSPSINLCPTHHQAIHRGLAAYVNGDYEWLVPDIVSGLKLKHPSVTEKIEESVDL